MLSAELAVLSARTGYLQLLLLPLAMIIRNCRNRVTAFTAAHRQFVSVCLSVCLSVRLYLYVPVSLSTLSPVRLYVLLLVLFPPPHTEYIKALLPPFNVDYLT